MYYPNDIEEICYEQDHIDKVWEEMKQIIPEYFQRYIDTEGGHSIQESEAEKLAEKFVIFQSQRLDADDHPLETDHKDITKGNDQPITDSFSWVNNIRQDKEHRS